MKLNPAKSSSIIFSRSRTASLIYLNILIDNQVIHPINPLKLLCVTSLKLLVVTFNSKLTFENHIKKTASLISQKDGLLWKCMAIFNDSNILKFIFSVILSFFGYCGPVWISAPPSHLRLLDHSSNLIKKIIPSLNTQLCHRRIVVALTLFLNNANNNQHHFHNPLLSQSQPIYSTR